MATSNWKEPRALRWNDSETDACPARKREKQRDQEATSADLFSRATPFPTPIPVERGSARK